MNPYKEDLMSEILAPDHKTTDRRKPPPPVRVPDATNLSWLAETADGTRGETLYLIKDTKEKLQLVSEGDLKGRAYLATVETPKKRRERQEVTEVVCHGKNYSATLKSTEKYDAVFWTESSIDKFLYPYYAAHRIWDERMDKVKKKFDDSDFAVAIAHRAPSTSEALAYEEVEVGVLDAGALTWMTVKQFLAYQP
jgi:hypothetical protein